jgi:hypothetical protein
MDIAVGHLSAENQEKCRKMDLIVDAIADGEPFQARKTIASLMGD